MHNSDPTPQGVENRNIRLWFKCVLTALHVNCMILLFKRMELIEVKSLIWAQKGKLYIIYENVM
jgi:hypothetical protein